MEQRNRAAVVVWMIKCDVFSPHEIAADIDSGESLRVPRRRPVGRVSHKLKPFRGSCTALLAEEGTKPGIDYSSVATVNNF